MDPSSSRGLGRVAVGRRSPVLSPPPQSFVVNVCELGESHRMDSYTDSGLCVRVERSFRQIEKLGPLRT